MEYNDGGFFYTARNTKGVMEIFELLGQLSVGKETDAWVDSVSTLITYYDSKTNQIFKLEFNGNNLIIGGKLYEVSDREKLKKAIELIKFYQEPSPPHFRAFSDEDPDNTTPKEFITPGDEDIAADPQTGTRYVKNQLIVEITDHNYSEMILQAADLVGAELIAYIDPENRAQFSFKDDVTLQQLEEKINMLQKLDYIKSASLYYVD